MRATLHMRPRHPERDTKAVIRVLRRVGHFQSTVLLSLIYLVCWLPVGLIARLSADWLNTRAPERSNWRLRAPRLNQPDHVRDPF
ncbi:MAG: hypothetical protein HYZ89_01040 [Candidatus Omnitrophica bacterium]|nr:hypothetical protein [Candidatus Omnitrophota bacterium]